MKRTTGPQDPSISVLIIARPEEPQLARAVRSVLQETRLDLELVVVLDGVASSPAPSLDGRDATDARLRTVALPQNVGRGAARQVALEHARGEWVTFLDADDWYTPDKLMAQWRRLHAPDPPDVLSTGLWIVDAKNQLRGVRRGGATGVGLMNGRLPAFPFAPTILRRTVALSIGFEARRRRGEDRAFLLRALKGRRWEVLDAPLYVYDEYGRHSLGRSLQAYGQRMVDAYARAREDGSTRAWSHAVGVAAWQSTKALASVGAFALGAGDALVGLRSTKATRAERIAFDEAQRQRGDA